MKSVFISGVIPIFIFLSLEDRLLKVKTEISLSMAHSNAGPPIAIHIYTVPYNAEINLCIYMHEYKEMSKNELVHS